jgi:hypothetical protein
LDLYFLFSDVLNKLVNQVQRVVLVDKVMLVQVVIAVARKNHRNQLIFLFLKVCFQLMF